MQKLKRIPLLDRVLGFVGNTVVTTADQIGIAPKHLVLGALAFLAAVVLLAIV